MVKGKDIKFDIILAVTVLFLLVFGLIMITSIGVPKSISLSSNGALYPSCSDQGVDCYLLFKKHLVRLVAGLLIFYFAFKVPIKFFSKISKPLFFLTVLMLFFVLVLGDSYGTIAKNWINIFNTSLQPSEFAKLSVALYLAYWFSKRGVLVKSLYDGFIPFVVILLFVIAPVMLQNDYGSVLVIGVICVSIYYVAGARFKHIMLGFLIAFLGAFIIILTIPHVKERFVSYSSIDTECLEDKCWQSQQANIAIGSGGAFGRGLTQGVTKSSWLPQATDDFIFAASAEELGFLRIIFLVFAYFMISYRGFLIASNASNQFEKYLATGITTWLTLQAYINIAVNTSLMPVTGITLPFVSYGGSSLVASLIGVGILLNISKNSSYARSTNRRGDRRTRNAQRGRYRRA